MSRPDEIGEGQSQMGGLKTGSKRNETERRVPTQNRSREKYEAILRACTELLRDEGYDATTPSKIAARAGVGKGVLYQYFPNKETIVATVVDVELDAFATLTLDSYQQPAGASPMELARGMLRMNVEIWLENRALLRVFFSEVPRVFQLDGYRRAEERLMDFARSLQQLLPEGDRPQGLDRKIHVLVDLITGYLFRITLAPPSEATAGEITDELMAVITGYLKESGL